MNPCLAPGRGSATHDQEDVMLERVEVHSADDLPFTLRPRNYEERENNLQSSGCSATGLVV